MDNGGIRRNRLAGKPPGYSNRNVGSRKNGWNSVADITFVPVASYVSR